MNKTIKKITLLIGVLVSIHSFSQVHTLKESIYFTIGKSSLTHIHKAKLDSIVILLKASKKYSGEIKGYTCNIGSTSLNKLISNLRALNVYNYLVDKGAQRESFTYMGLGSTNPVGDNKTAAGRIKNRRTDIEVLLSLFDENTADNGDNNGPSNSSNNNGSNSNDIVPIPTTEIGGTEFVSGKIPAKGDKNIKTTNGISIAIDKNTFITSSKEDIEFDFKDYTKNYDIIKKGFVTKSNDKYLQMLGAFTVSFTQEYQELAVNSNKPFKVYIPGEYDPNIKLYNYRYNNWTEDTINKITYNQSKKAYEVSVIFNRDIIGLLNPISDSVKYLKIKIKGISPDVNKPYIIYNNCYISNGYRLKGKWFVFPIVSLSDKYSLRGQYIDYSSKQPEYYSLEYDITNLSPVGSPNPAKANDIIQIKYPEKIEYKKEKLRVSSLCEVPAE